MLKQVFRGFTAAFSVVQERKPMWSFRPVQVRVRREQAFHDRRVSEHGKHEDVGARALPDQVFSDLTVTHVPGAFQGRLEIAAADIPARVQQAGPLLQHVLHLRQVIVPYANELLHQLQLKLSGLHGWHRFLRARLHWQKEGATTEQRET